MEVVRAVAEQYSNRQYNNNNNNNNNNPSCSPPLLLSPRDEGVTGGGAGETASLGLKTRASSSCNSILNDLSQTNVPASSLVPDGGFYPRPSSRERKVKRSPSLTTVLEDDNSMEHIVQDRDLHESKQDRDLALKLASYARIGDLKVGVWGWVA